MIAPFFFGCGQSRETAARSAPGWSELRTHALASITNDPYWQKRWWLEKTARLLRAGDGISPDENVDAWMKLSETDIVKELMADPRFVDTVLDFNMYFLGFKLDLMRDGNGNYQSLVFDYPSAVVSAQHAVAGDYLSLFDLEGPVFAAPLSAPPTNQEDPSEAGLDSLQLRDKRIREFDEKQRVIIDRIKNDPSLPIEEACRLARDSSRQAETDILNVGVPTLLLIKGPDLDPEWYSKLRSLCGDQAMPQQPPARDALVATLERVLERNDKLFAEVRRFDSTLYKPRSVRDFMPIDLAATTIPGPMLQLGFEQASALPNSSTNFERKRAAYMLKHFFCDDLTPVGVEDPQQHTGGAHGSDTSCFACHYKLDPMAGFFRNHGIFLADFSQVPFMIFDDQVNVDRATYENNWRAKPGSGREWEVGYVRSPNAEKENSYGSTIADLGRIIRQAPEAKRCVVKRLFEYFVAENQTIDAGYLDDLTRRFEATAAVNSSQAFRETVTALLTSRTFHEPNPDPKECYDHGPGGVAADAPPCRVAFILQGNCVQCHSSTSGKGNLDLSRWITMPDGSFGFPHLDENGQQLSSAETLEEIGARLSSSDIDERMPLKKIMTSQDRQELYLWSQESLNNLAKAVR